MNQPEMIVSDLPPRRHLPSDVRERMRRRVVRGKSVRAPLAAAAAVALLAAGGAIVAQSTQGDTIAVAPPTNASTTASGSYTVTAVSQGASEDDLKKCGFTRAYVRFTIGLPGRRIVVAEEYRLCEITHTGVSTNRREAGTIALAGGAARLLWRTGSGLLVGRAPFETTRVETTAPAQNGIPLVEDLFVIPNPSMWMSLVFTTPSGPVPAEIKLDVTPGPDWAAWREELPPGDPEVARCLDTTMRESGAQWVDDPLKWRPGALAASAVDGVLVIHDQAGKTAYCQVDHGRMIRARPGDTSPQGDALIKVRYVAGGATGHGPTDAYDLIAGTVDEAKVGGVEITDPQGQTLPATLRDGTFAVLVANQPPQNGTAVVGRHQAKVFDHENRVIATVTL